MKELPTININYLLVDTYVKTAFQFLLDIYNIDTYYEILYVANNGDK